MSIVTSHLRKRAYRGPNEIDMAIMDSMDSIFTDGYMQSWRMFRGRSRTLKDARVFQKEDLIVGPRNPSSEEPSFDLDSESSDEVRVRRRSSDALEIRQTNAEVRRYSSSERRSTRIGTRTDLRRIEDLRRIPGISEDARGRSRTLADYHWNRHGLAQKLVARFWVVWLFNATYTYVVGPMHNYA